MIIARYMRGTGLEAAPRCLYRRRGDSRDSDSPTIPTSVSVGGSSYGTTPRVVGSPPSIAAHLARRGVSDFPLSPAHGDLSGSGHLDGALPHRRPADLQLEEDDGNCAGLPAAVRGAVGGTDREVGRRVLGHHVPFEAVGGGGEAARIRL
jgi:hypothetical protein